MLKKVFLLFAVILMACSVFSATFNETEPNGCITLIDGNDPYQALQSGDTLFGAIQISDNEGCLYFEYTDGNEDIEDLYALNVYETGDYTVMLNFAGPSDLDLFVFDLGLNLLNGDDCGGFICGYTCGSPEIVNLTLDPGTYLIGVSLAAVYSCGALDDAGYILSVLPFSGGDKPRVTSMAKAGNPFRLLVFGNNFESDTRIFISGSEWQNLRFNGTELIKIKKGKSLKAMFPKDGSWVPITIVNSNNQSTSIEYNRLHNLWREAGR